MIVANPRNCSGVRSPRSIFTSTAENPSWRWAWTLASTKRSNSVRSPFGEAAVAGAFGALASSSSSKRRRSTSSGPNSRSATQSPSSSSSTCSRKASIPILSTRTLIRARARLTRSHSWRSKMRKTASATLR